MQILDVHEYIMYSPNANILMSVRPHSLTLASNESQGKIVFRMGYIKRDWCQAMDNVLFQVCSLKFFLQCCKDVDV